MIWLMFFFKSLTDTVKFFHEVNKPKLIATAITTEHRFRFIVVIGKPDPKTVEELDKLGMEEYEKARKYSSFLSHESALKPTDIDGLHEFIHAEI